MFERTRSGEEREWGSVTAWDPPTRLELTWDRNETVKVAFQVEADGTRVTVIHTGWRLAGVQAFAAFVSEQMLLAV